MTEEAAARAWIDPEVAFQRRQDTVVAFVLEAVAVAGGGGDAANLAQLREAVRADHAAMDARLRVPCSEAADARPTGPAPQPAETAPVACPLPAEDEIDIPGYCPT